MYVFIVAGAESGIEMLWFLWVFIGIGLLLCITQVKTKQIRILAALFLAFYLAGIGYLWYKAERYAYLGANIKNKHTLIVEKANRLGEDKTALKVKFEVKGRKLLKIEGKTYYIIRLKNIETQEQQICDSFKLFYSLVEGEEIEMERVEGGSVYWYGKICVKLEET